MRAQRPGEADLNLKSIEAGGKYYERNHQKGSDR